MVPTSGPLLVLRGEGGKWCLTVHLFPEGTLHLCCFFGTCSKMSNWSPYYAPQVCCRLLFPGCMSMGFLPCIFFKAENILGAPSEPSMLTFKTPGFKSYCYKNSGNLGPLVFPSQMVGRFAFPMH